MFVMTNKPDTPFTEKFHETAVIGSGAMGTGIAQMLTQAGCRVRVFDQNGAQAEKAVAGLRSTWAKLVDKGRMSQTQADDCAARLAVVGTVAELANTDLVVEAIVERLDVKQALFKELEAIVPPDCVLATNTSSLSVTSIAAACGLPQRVAGLHFFNPVPLMKVVEVIAGLHTEPQICHRLGDLVRQFGHTAVTAQDTPGFIVNHAGRGFGTEALRIVSEGVADFATIDRILKDQAGFKLGPFELMDLTALDVSHPVMESIYHQYFEEPRYRPSPITAQRLAGRALGRKTSQGFYRYENNSALWPPEERVPTVGLPTSVWLSPRAARRAEVLALLKSLGARIETAARPSDSALILVAPLGFDVTTVAAVDQLDASRTVGIDMLIADTATRRRVLATNPATRPDIRAAAHALFASDGKPVSMIRDSGGFVTQRVLATIINIGADICQQRICTPTDLDLAVTLGLGYPQGPLAWGDALGPANVLEVLFNLQTVYGDPRYRPSPWLRRRAALGLFLTQAD
jgi:3-hydroxybutyryl-CoA dehydrogenase